MSTMTIKEWIIITSIFFLLGAFFPIQDRSKYQCHIKTMQ